MFTRFTNSFRSIEFVATYCNERGLFRLPRRLIGEDIELTTALSPELTSIKADQAGLRAQFAALSVSKSRNIQN